MELHWNEDFRLVGVNLTQPLVFLDRVSFLGFCNDWIDPSPPLVNGCAACIAIA